MLEHNENFELESEYEEIWDKIRYTKVDELYELTEDVIQPLDNHIEDKLLFNEDYEKIQNLFKKMKQKNFFYMSKSAKEIIKSANPKSENVKIYRSVSFNDVTYKIKIDNYERVIGSSYFEGVS